jgi:hypothetical protein
MARRCLLHGRAGAASATADKRKCPIKHRMAASCARNVIRSKSCTNVLHYYAVRFCTATTAAATQPVRKESQIRPGFCQGGVTATVSDGSFARMFYFEGTLVSQLPAAQNAVPTYLIVTTACSVLERPEMPQSLISEAQIGKSNGRVEITRYSEEHYS